MTSPDNAASTSGAVRRSRFRTSIAGVAVKDIAARFGTPVFVYDESVIVERIRSLECFDVVRYAQKALSNIAILDLCRRHGVLVDATSAGEMERAFAAGYSASGDPAPIVYTADIFDRSSLDLVVAKGVHVNCGSADMIQQYAAQVGGGAVTLRVNPGFGHGHSKKTNTGGEHSKHGIWHESLADAVELARRCGVTVSGLHVHIGSGSDLEHLSQVCGALERLARSIGDDVTTISAGGGLPVPYREAESHIDVPAYFERWDSTRRSLEKSFGHPVRLEIEPGRYLVAESGYLVAEVRAVKRMGANEFYLLDAGFNNLIRPAMYGAYHPMSLTPADGNNDRPLRDVVVGGPLCESGDIFTQGEGGVVRTELLPQAEVGDLLVIEVAGAYGSAMSSNYNSKPLAPEVLIRDGRPHLIRARQSLDDLIRGERIPSL
ncbi:MAG TPA: diaminopimelate decarboxylase [Candidatus Limnocylindrales bacterium]|nr:diaminopimelate decarboxylase [Candidatus Limnocylindrales bacterium]